MVKIGDMTMAVGAPRIMPGRGKAIPNSWPNTRPAPRRGFPGNINRPPMKLPLPKGPLRAPYLTRSMIARLGLGFLTRMHPLMGFLIDPLLTSGGRGKFYTVGPGPYTGPTPWWRILEPRALAANGVLENASWPTLHRVDDPSNTGAGLHPDGPWYTTGLDVWISQEDVGKYWSGGRAIRKSVYLRKEWIERGWVGAVAPAPALNPALRPDAERRLVYRKPVQYAGDMLPEPSPLPYPSPIPSPAPVPAPVPGRVPPAVLALVINGRQAQGAGFDRTGGKGRPGKRQDEKKRFVGAALAAQIRQVVNRVGDALEALDILAAASGWRYDREIGGSKVYNKAMWLFAEGGISNLALDDLIREIILNEIEDRVIGKVARGARWANDAYGSKRPFGLQTGLAL